MKKPLKRAKEIQPYSKDHHHGLLLGWKLRTGLKKQIAIGRMEAYAQWFYANYLAPHFELEEKYLFPVLRPDDGLVKKALDEHAAIRSLMRRPASEEKLTELAGLLESHIRFEERELFEKIQEAATEEQLHMISEVHDDVKFMEHPDEFWK